MKFRILPLINDLDPYEQFALDNSILEQASMGYVPPTLRFYTIKSIAISIGYFNDLHRCVDVEKVQALGIPIIRRISGGNSILHNNENDLMYSLIIPHTSMKIALEYVARIVEGSLRKLNISITYDDLDKFYVGNRIIGEMICARRGGAILVQGVIRIRSKAEELMNMLFKHVNMKNIPHEQLAKYTTFEELGIKNIDIDIVTNSIINELKNYVDLFEGSISENELRLTDEIVTKYRSWDWLFSRYSEGYRVKVKKCKYKKYVEIAMTVSKGIITRCLIAGNFYAYPESAIDALQKSLVNKRDVNKIRNIISSLKAELIGIEINDLIDVTLAPYKELSSL